VRFIESVRAITPGQAAVFYGADDADPRVLGGGWIKDRTHSCLV
jgi:tRNA U34 2-thiouridine synthase MnmA/TrmU